MTLRETLDRIAGIQWTRRRLLLIAVPVVVIAGWTMTGSHTNNSQKPARRESAANAATTPECGTTKMRVTVFGRSLVTYDWQSGNCPSVTVKAGQGRP